MAFEDARPLEALYLSKNAAQLEPMQSFGTPPDRAQFDNLMQAEYRNSMAVIYHTLGWDRNAEDAAEEAARRNWWFAEAHYNLGVLKLLDAQHADGTPGLRTTLLQQARSHLATATVLDPGFRPASATLAAVQALAGNCSDAEQTIAAARKSTGLRRLFPVETGEGIQHSAAIGRHKSIDAPPLTLEPDRLLAECQQAQQASREP